MGCDTAGWRVARAVARYRLRNLLAEGLDELLLDGDDLHVGDGLARGGDAEAERFERVDGDVLGPLDGVVDGVLLGAGGLGAGFLLVPRLVDGRVLIGFDAFELEPRLRARSST